MPVPRTLRSIDIRVVGPLLAIFSLALAGCSLERYSPLKMCTLMGCRDSLTIELIGEIPQSFTIEATASDGTSRTATCSDGRAELSDAPGGGLSAICGSDSVAFFEFTPAEVTVQLRSDSGVRVETFQPEYHPFRPNGEDCPPECLSGTIAIAIP